MIQAIIVAAGGGTRLYPLSDIIPKVLFPVGRRQLSVGHRIINHCKEHGIRNFLFCVNNWTGQQVQHYFEDGERFGVEIYYSLSSEPLGTAGELKVAWERGLIDEKTIIYYGDTICKTNLTELIELHEQDGADVTITVNDNIKLSVGYVEDWMGAVRKISEKPTINELNISFTSLGEVSSVGGVLPIFYITRNDFYENFCNIGKDVMADVIPEMLDLGYNIMAYHDKEPFVDIGSWKDYKMANEEWE